MRPVPSLRAFAAFTSMLAMVAMASSAAAKAPTLGSLGASHGLLMGSAVRFWHLDPETGVFSSPFRNDATYRARLAEEFSVLTPENVMKMGPLQPQQGVFDFELADELVAFAEANGQAVRGHVLVWHSQVPDWLAAAATSKGKAKSLMKRHITAVAKHFRGRIHSWDVVNEAINDATFGLRETVWSQIGPKYIEKAFRWARKADPDALLCYNDYNHLNSAGWQKGKSDAIYALVKGLAKKKLIDCIGFQGHVTTDLVLDGVAENFQRYADLGLYIQITELDVRLELPASAADLQAQADMYRQVLEYCLGSGMCNAFVTWGYTDRYSWIPDFLPGFGDALILDADFQAKAAYDALMDALQ